MLHDVPIRHGIPALTRSLWYRKRGFLQILSKEDWMPYCAVIHGREEGGGRLGGTKGWHGLDLRTRLLRILMGARGLPCSLRRRVGSALLLLRVGRLWGLVRRLCRVSTVSMRDDDVVRSANRATHLWPGWLQARNHC